MIQFEYNSTMKRYDIKVPYNLADEGQEMVTVASISEQNKLNLLRELSVKLVKQILMNWDEYEHQMTRDLNDLFDDNNQECKHLMKPETCMSCEEEKGDK